MQAIPLLRPLHSSLSAVALGLALAAMAPQANADVTWSENFETAAALTNWSISNGTWQIGIPTSGPGAAHGGLRLAATVLDGNYIENTNSRLVSPVVTVPAADQNPRLRFWNWWSISTDDYGIVQVSTNNGSTWTNLSGQYVWSGDGRWSQAWLDLSAYAGQSIRIGFYFYSHVDYAGRTYVSSGWHIDDVAIETGTEPSLQNPESFESGWGGWKAQYAGGWATDSALWEVGSPTSGPSAAHGGAGCLATILNGSYPESRSSRMVSPPYTVPAADQNPRLRFWHWWSISNDDLGKVQVSTNNGATWADLSGQYVWTSDGKWSRAWLDLSAYAGQSIRIGFYFYSNVDYAGRAYVSSGWYIDDVAIETGTEPPMQNPEGFENGWGGWKSQYAGGWATDSAIWQVGTPTSGPGAAHGGTGCLATILDGNYPESRSSRMVSPSFTVPAADQNPRLRFWHWWSISNDDLGKVQVSTNNGTTWTDLSGQYVWTSGGGWTQSSFEISSYAGQTIRIGFYFYSNVDYAGRTYVGPGWYIDDVHIDVDSLNPADFPNQTVTENHPLTITTSTTLTNPEFTLKAGAPTGMTINPTTGQINWTPSEAQGPGYYPVTVELRQTGNNLSPVDSVSFEVQVLEENNAPVLPVYIPQTAQVSAPFSFNASGSDPDSANTPNRSLISRADFEDLSLGVWTPYSVASNKNWTATEYDGRYAEMFGYAGDVASEDWLISPLLNLDQYGSETLNFLSRWQYAGPALDVFYSTDYSGSGNPNAATWTSLTAACAWPIVSNEWVGSGVIDLSGISGPAVYIAFRYKSTGTTNSTAKLWQLDNIELIGTPTSVTNNTDILTYSLLNAPTGMTIDPVTGVITWTPTAQQTGSHQVTVVATDNGVPPLSASTQLTVNVGGGNTPPYWQPPLPAPSPVNEGALLTFTATATDSENNPITYSLAPGAPSGMSVNPGTGVVTWQTTEGSRGNYAITILADDAMAGHTPVPMPAPLAITVNEFNLAPTMPAISNMNVNEQTTLAFTVTATDHDVPPNPLVYALENGAPAGATIHPVTGAFSWTPTEEQGPGEYPITIKATDSNPTAVNSTSLTASRTFTVTVGEVNRPPVLAAIGPVNPLANGGALDFTATATDPDLPANTLGFSLAAGAPAGATIHPSTGAFHWMAPEVSQPTNYQVTVIVTDNGTPAHTDSETVTIRVLDDFGSWLREHFGNDANDPAKQATVWGDYADPDRDGTSNLIEFMTMRNPKQCDCELGPQFRVENGWAFLSYNERKSLKHGAYMFGSLSPDLDLWLYAGIDYVQLEDRGDHYRMEMKTRMNRQKCLYMRMEAWRLW